jgi:hypothetical protein
MDPRPPQAPHKRELSPVEQEIAKSFEIIDEEDRVDAILVWRKLKNATELYFDADTNEEKIKEVKVVMEKAGMFFHDSGKREFAQALRRICFIANSQKDLESVSEMWFADRNDPKVYLELGRLFRYPKTSVDIYDEIHRSENQKSARSELALSEKERHLLVPSDLRGFTAFVLSKAHWQEELNTSRKWAEEVKLVDPKLYDDIKAHSAY